MRSLHGILQEAIRMTLAATPVLAVGCGGYEAGIEGDPGFVPVQCEGGTPLWTPDLTPEPPVDYLELRHVRGILAAETRGERCGNATDRDACERSLAEISPQEGFPFGQTGQATILAQLLATRGDEVIARLTHDQAIAFLAPIDTHGEALFAVALAGYGTRCDRGGSRTAAAGFHVQSFTSVGCDGRNRQLLHVTASGAVRLLDQIEEKEPDPNCAVGRRPAGLCRADRGTHATALGEYLARGAALEAASVHAFRRLEAELHEQAAPPALLRAARRSALDEVRHAAVMARLARRFGGAPQAPRIDDAPPRDLETIAVENAAEGCVRETYGALTAEWQALWASDDELSIAYQRIARDELRHAGLAWRVARWAEQRLGARARRRVREASVEAARTLSRELREEVHPDVVRLAGVPRPAAAQRLFTHVAARLWAPPEA